MAQDLELKVGRDYYQTKIDVLDGKVTELNGILGEYEALNRNVTKFMEDGDDNFAAMQQNVRENIKAVKAAIETVTQTKKKLEEILGNMDDAGQNLNTILTEGAETVKNVVSSTFKVAQILD